MEAVAGMAVDDIIIGITAAVRAESRGDYLGGRGAENLRLWNKLRGGFNGS